MFHKNAGRVHYPARSFHVSAIIGISLVLVLLTFVVHFTLAWSNAQAATLVLGQPNFMSSTSGATQTTMNSPDGVAVDPTSGKVFVADANNNRVLRFLSLATLSNGNPPEAVLGQPNFTSTTTGVSPSTLDSPGNVIVDSSGRLWVADFNNNRVLRFDNAATKTNGANADGVLGQPDFTTKVSATTQAGMNRPDDMAIDGNGALWVADTNNSRVLRFDSAATRANGANANRVLGQSSFITNVSTTTQAGMNAPFGVEIDSNGRLWVADYSNNRVLRFDNATNKADGANADGVLGQPDFTTSKAATTQAGMNGVNVVKMDNNGRLWAADYSNNRVLRFDNAATKTNGANADGLLGQSNFTTNVAVASPSGMYDPYAVALDSSGGLWVTDSGNNRVLYFANPAKLDTIGIDRGGTFYLRLHNSTGSSDISTAFNPASKPFPIVGDWTGTGFDTVGVYDQNNSVFSLRNSNTAGSPDEQLVFGNSNDTPLSGRWLFSATHAGVGVFRSSNGILYVQNALTTGFSDHAMVLGNPGDQGVAGDWTGRGYDGLGIFRPSGNAFYLVNQVADGVIFSDINFLFGASTDLAITGDWIGQGHDGVGTFRPTTGNIYLRNTLTTGVSDNAFVYGVAGDQPVAGHWQAIYPPIAPHNNVPAPVLIPKTALPQPTMPGNSVPGGNQIGG